MLTKNILKINKEKLLSASVLSNYIKNDPIIDYLELLKKKNLLIEDEIKKKKRKRTNSEEEITDSNKKKKTSFDYIVQSGNFFENDIIKKIKKMMKDSDEYQKIIKIDETDIELNCNKTINVIKNNKHNIILNSILVNKNNNTWGKPDIIVRGDWIEKYIEDKIENLDLKKWYIIDIKSSTINLINKGENVSSKLLYNI